MDVKQNGPVRRSLFPPVPAVAGRQLVIVPAAAYASDSGESLHCFLFGANKSYVIATSGLLPSLPTQLPFKPGAGEQDWK